MATGAGIEPTMCESKSHVFPITPTRYIGGLPFSDKPASKRYTVFIVDYGYHSTQKVL